MKSNNKYEYILNTVRMPFSFCHAVFQIVMLSLSLRFVLLLWNTDFTGTLTVEYFA